MKGYVWGIVGLGVGAGIMLGANSSPAGTPPAVVIRPQQPATTSIAPQPTHQPVPTHEWQGPPTGPDWVPAPVPSQPVWTPAPDGPPMDNDPSAPFPTQTLCQYIQGPNCPQPTPTFTPAHPGEIIV